MITATGLGSGLDITSLVSQLVEAERAGSDLQLDRQTAQLNSKFSALGSVKSVLSTFQSTLSDLNDLSSYGRNSASSSVPLELGISADSTAQANSYFVEVTQLAQSHSLASLAVADTNTTTLGTGTITIRFGTTDYNSGTDTYNSFTLKPDSSVATINIDSSNNTLSGVMNAINAAGAGVNASIVNDGVGYRLLLTSESTGLENSLEISVTDDDGNNIDTGGLSQLVFNSSATHLEQAAAAKDALLTINGLSISNPSNSVTSAIDGVTLDLKQTTSGVVDLSVQSDNSAVIDGVNRFIAGYNQFINAVNALSAYDAENDVPSPLVGDFTVRSINSQIDTILRNSVAGLTASVTSLSEIGITTSKSGTLELDVAELNSALADKPDEVTRIFAALGVPTDPDIQFESATAETAVGTYDINITNLATTGTNTGTSVLPNFGIGETLTIDADNDELAVEIDGVSTSTITLTNAVYSSGAALASEIEAQINGATALRDASITVSVTYDNGSNNLVISSDSFGSSSSVDVLSVDTNTAAELGFGVSSGTVGTDVAGTIDGVAATGAGKVLLAVVGSDAVGLRLTIGGTTTGNRGNVEFSRGIVNQLDLLMEQLLDTEGALEDRINAFKDRIDEVSERRERLELRWEAVEARYTRQFNSLDILLSSLQSTSNYMEQQFENLLTPNTGQQR